MQLNQICISNLFDTCCFVISWFMGSSMIQPRKVVINNIFAAKKSKCEMLTLYIRFFRRLNPRFLLFSLNKGRYTLIDLKRKVNLIPFFDSLLKWVWSSIMLKIKYVQNLKFFQTQPPHWFFMLEILYDWMKRLKTENWKTHRIFSGYINRLRLRRG